MVTINPYLGVSKKPDYQKNKANKYNKIAMRRYGINLNKKKEKSLIKWLEDHKPYQTTIKRLIREEMIREKQSKKEQNPKKP